MRTLLTVALGAASLGVLVACLVGGSAGELALGVLATAFAPLLMLLGAADHEGRVGAAALPIALLLVVLEAAFVGLWVQRGQVEGGSWWLGLPAATAIQIYGLLLVPQAIVALGFALTFRRFDVGPEALRELGRRAPRAEE